jgi:DNA replication and repair protein RecF
MRLEKLEVSDYRNIVHAELIPGQELTVICGNNGQGKTNLLEAIWLLTGGKSFRGGKDAELIRRGSPFAVLEAKTYREDGTETQVRITVGTPESGRPGRCAKKNGADIGRAAALAGSFPAVVFDPGHLSLVKGSPDGRRRFLDAALCQLYPGYLAVYRRYVRTVTQKNALLKNWERTRDAGDVLEALNTELALRGEEIQARRLAYLQLLTPFAVENYARLSRGAEALSLQYAPNFSPGTLKEKLRQERQNELRAGFCLAGPHREDINILLDGQSARVFASQGQQRSAVLSLKLAEAACVREITGEWPVMLLDDVLSELDDGRKEYLLTRMKEKQTFVTSCDDDAFLHTDGVIYKMNSGTLSRVFSAE